MCRGRELRAGLLSLWFDEETGSIRRIRVGERELIRQVYGAVRNKDWGTVRPLLREMRLRDRGADGFEIEFTADCREPWIDYRWRGRISGGQEEVRFEFDGEAQSDFQSNRIGLCLLHPAEECAGHECEVEHVDGRIESGRFPRLISPHQPFREVRAITQSAGELLLLEARLEGEVFEMEDQRNWSDSSFKIYAPPLDRPYPVNVRRGDRVRHVITIRLLGKQKGEVVARAPEEPVIVRVDWGRQSAKAQLGFGWPKEGTISKGMVRERLRLLRPDHLRVDCYLWGRNWEERLGEAAEAAREVGTSLEVALFLGPEPERELRRVHALCQQLEAPVARWLLLHRTEACTSPKWVGLAREILQQPGAEFAAGTDGNFAEVNRNRPPGDADWLLCYPMNPQVHAFDSLTLVENLAAQAETVRTARSFSKKEVVVSPITLLPRAAPSEEGERRQAGADPRQQSLFGAGWTLGSLAGLMGTEGVRSLTYYETSGRSGLMSEDGAKLFPIYHVFAGVAELERLARVEVNVAGALKVAALAGMNRAGRGVVWLANLTGAELEIRLESDGRLGGATVRRLDERNVAEAMRSAEALAGSNNERWNGQVVRITRYGLARLEQVD